MSFSPESNKCYVYLLTPPKGETRFNFSCSHRPTAELKFCRRNPYLGLYALETNVITVVSSAAAPDALVQGGGVIAADRESLTIWRQPCFSPRN
jgi:hypothetical protein